MLNTELTSKQKISIERIQDLKLHKIQFRIFTLSLGVLAPIAVGLMIWSNYRTHEAALAPVVQQIRQGMQTGDEISIQRASHTLLNLPGTVAVVVTSNQGAELLKQTPTGTPTNESRWGVYTISKTIEDAQGLPLGTIEARFLVNFQLIAIILFSIVTVALLILYGIRPVLFQSLAELTSGIQHLPQWIRDGKAKEIEIAELDFAYQELMRLKVAESEAVRLQAHKATSLQVAHDIRSPLSALEMISNHLNELPEEVRTVIRGSIQRIRDIANTLSNSKQWDPQTATSNATVMAPVFLEPLIEQMVSEKRVENRHHFELAIEFEPSDAAYGTFVKIDSVELKRVISNLLNNSIEAILSHTATARSRPSPRKVQVTLDADSRFARIKIIDEGPGMSPEVLAQVGTPGFSAGKMSGSGLGLAHAFTQIQNAGGTLAIHSTLGVGTEVEIALPLTLAPTWFLPRLTLGAGETAVVIDDEPTIHQLFKNRLGSKRVQSATHSRELESVLKNFAGGIFLVDYEFHASNEWGEVSNGFDLIDQYRLAQQAVLVTSHFENPAVIEECTRRGMKLLPKPMARVVPVLEK